MAISARIAAFLGGRPHAVVGASRDRAKYGNKVLRCYMQHERPVYPVNPHAAAVEGLLAYADLGALPESVHGISIITPPQITAAIVAEAAAAGIEHLWMQPGAESPCAISRAAELGLSLIADGSCILVVLGYSEQYG